MTQTAEALDSGENKTQELRPIANMVIRGKIISDVDEVWQASFTIRALAD